EGLNRWIAVSALSGVALSLVSIFLSDLLLGVSLLLWVVHCVRERRLILQMPPFAPALLALIVLTATAVLFSYDPLRSAVYLKTFLKFAYVFLLFTFATPEQISRGRTWIFAIGLCSASYGMLQYFWLKDVSPLNRIDGFMSHWMTFSGQMMLLLTAGFAFFLQRLARRDQPVASTLWIAAALLLLFAALVLSGTRSAWLGAAVGILALTLFGRGRWLLAFGACALAAFLLIPDSLRSRAYSAFDLQDRTTSGRIELLQTGAGIVREHPLTGVGPRMVRTLAYKYRSRDDFPQWLYMHLHNNLLQVAAEAGIPAALAWLALWLWPFCHFWQGWRRLREGAPSSAAAGAGMAVIAAFLTAGIFEFNYGDSEILTLLLFWVTAPYVKPSQAMAPSEASVVPHSAPAGGR
ncbi:MAG TPA: O-antigen ligase family protein, partial [Acidobacteriota bacterium]|nr:O-antigen ligase family protein [Acidobacteriota bacterium]